MLDDGCVQLLLSHDVYERAAVVEAAQAYAGHHLHVAVLSTSADETEIVVRTSPPGPESERLLSEFLNHALDLSIRRKLGRG
jgi:hypothetical protein